MAFKMKFLMLLSVILVTTQASAREEYSSEQYLKNFALSTCVSIGYQSEKVKKDAAAASRGYLEFGDYSLSAHTAARKLAQEFLARKYGSQSGEPMILAKCIDLYNSKELQKLVDDFKDKKDD